MIGDCAPEEEGNGNIEGVLAPEYGEPAFAEYLASDPLLNYAMDIRGKELRLGWITLCANPPGYDTGWHRDLGPAKDNTYDEEMALLSRPMIGLRYQVALVDDPCLWLVPGSHRRYRTEEERQTALIECARHLTRDAMTHVLGLEKGSMIVFHCHHGGRSQGAAQEFVEKGFSSVYNLAGGIDAWSATIDPSVPRY